ncbi:MAG TPA: O-antigen ligase family protein [Ramlibacter sp.]|nr:O-antigen ligase family protein [Ramlibacter sp.]
MAQGPAEPARDGGAAQVLALAIFLAPAVGVPGELMLQDTLKSAVVSIGALIAAGLFIFSQRTRQEPLRWHAVAWLPLVLCAAALGSIAWSHRYLASVEAIRWFVFALIVWVALNAFTRERLAWLAAAVHGGALAASLWAALQFWAGLDLFPQGPQPASTFINRNFFAEFAVCSLPFSALLLARARSGGAVAALAASNGFVVTAILMTGTRSALIALWLQVLVAWPLVVWRCHQALPCGAWPLRQRLLAAAVALLTVLVLGALPSTSAKILEEGHGANAIERGLVRTQSIGPADYSLGVRMVMWRATLKVIAAHPVTGVGAGAWESEVPRYQEEGAQLETDYYVHNEFLQLIAEYGVVGWVVLAGLAAYLLAATWRSWRQAGAAADAERPWRAALLCSLLALMVVSNIGFPWRLASTGALFALCLGALAASDVRLGWGSASLWRPLRWSPLVAKCSLAATAGCLALALFITERAAAAERSLVRAANLALYISRSGRPNDPMFDALKQDMLQLARDGIRINPHYRKITPMIADELARWGDWRRATIIWESVLASRPNIVVLLTNAARGHSAAGRFDQAFAYLERARQVQPNAPAVRSLEVLLLARSGQEALAARKAQEALQAGIVDHDLLNSAFLLAWRAKDYPLARRMLQRRMEEWPDTRERGREQLAQLEAEAAAQTSASNR